MENQNECLIDAECDVISHESRITFLLEAIFGQFLEKSGEEAERFLSALMVLESELSGYKKAVSDLMEFARGGNGNSCCA